MTFGCQLLFVFGVPLTIMDEKKRKRDDKYYFPGVGFVKKSKYYELRKLELDKDVSIILYTCFELLAKTSIFLLTIEHYARL